MGENPVHCRGVDPAQHGDELVVGVDPGQVAAGAAGAIAGRRRALAALPGGVEPPEIAVLRIELAWHRRAVDPGLADQPFAGQQSPALHQEADARLVARVDEDAAAPMAAARDRFDRPAVDLDRRVAVAAPAPFRRGAKRGHERLAKDVRQRAAKEPQEREADAVDANVVVFPETPWRLQLPGLALAAAALEHEVAVAIDDVGLAPQRALPFGGLLQEMVPGDPRIVRRGEAAIIDAPTDPLRAIRAEAARPRHAREQRERAPCCPATPGHARPGG